MPDQRRRSGTSERERARAARTWSPAPGILVCAAGTLLSACGRPEALVVHGLRTPDGGGDATVTLVAADGRIGCFGPAAACSEPEDARVLDAAGRWIIPGLIDTHVHLVRGHAPRETARDQALRLMLGITTVREATTAGNGYGPADSARAASPGTPVPRIVPTGRLARRPLERRGLRDPTALVPMLVEEGARSIKLRDEFPPAELREAIEAAHHAGVPVWGHTWTSPPYRSFLRSAVEAGLDGISHLTSIPGTLLGGEISPPDSVPDERLPVWQRSLWLEPHSADLGALARELAGRDVWLEPLLVVEASFVDSYRVPYELRRLMELPWVLETLLREPPPPLGPEGRATMTAALDRMRRFVREFHDAGGRVVAGTDNQLAPGLALHEELRQLVEAGLTPLEAIRAATRDAAVALAVDDRLGTLEPGKLADFVILEEDPRLDIGHTLRIWRIGKGGRLYDPNVLYDELTREPGILSRSGGRLVVALLAMAAALLALAWAIHRSGKGRPEPRPRRVRWR